MNEEVIFEQDEISKIVINLCLPMPIKPETYNNKKKVIVLAGPTGCGKTKLSLMLAKEMDGEIVSADSVQVYKNMDIGTAKVSLENRQEVPHHLLDICNVSEQYSVVDFYYDARNACSQIHSRNKIPIVVGGSGFYVHTMIYGPPEGPPPVKKVRDALYRRMSEKGPDFLYDKLCKYDSEYASTITNHDRHKIVRALEIIELTGDKVSKLPWGNMPSSLNYDFCCWFLYRPREVLYSRVEKTV